MLVEHLEVVGFEHAFRGMRNPKNSWKNSDSKSLYMINDQINKDPNNLKIKDINDDHQVLFNANGYDIISSVTLEDDRKLTQTMKVKSDGPYFLGDKDLKLAKSLINAGSVHSKFERSIYAYMDITASFDFWKEYDTYKVATVANSCSTMHKITSRDISLTDYSLADLRQKDIDFIKNTIIPYLNEVVNNEFLSDLEKTRILSKINLMGYQQKRTLTLSYATLHNIYTWRHNHKLYEWRYLCNEIIKYLPYFNALYIEE